LHHKELDPLLSPSHSLSLFLNLKVGMSFSFLLAVV